MYVCVCVCVCVCQNLEYRKSVSFVDKGAGMQELCCAILYCAAVTKQHSSYTTNN